VLHMYAGLFCMRLAQRARTNVSRGSQGTREVPKRMISVELISLPNVEQRPNQVMPREAQQYLDRARALDPEGVIPQAFIHKVRWPP
jgi:hypothetical protein